MEQSWLNWRYYPALFLEALREITKKPVSRST